MPGRQTPARFDLLDILLERRLDLPGDTLDILIKRGQASRSFQVSNPSLLWNKIFPSSWKAKDIKKGEFIDYFIRSFGSGTAGQWLNNFNARLAHCIESLNGYYIDRVQGEVLWRLAIGMGASQPFTETGITLHNLYGFPYIPGSAAKGATRSFALSDVASKLGIEPLDPVEYDKLKAFNPPRKTPLEAFETWLDDENDRALTKLPEESKKLLSNEDIRREINLFRKIFGTTNLSGQVLFFDAPPLVQPKLDKDIMNVHYQEYYQNKGLPADYSEPTLIYFLTVGKGTVFVFHLASKEQHLLETTKSWLSQAVTQVGIGAKTRVGYGELRPR